MECDKWLEEGLLHASGELSTEAARAFEQHIAECLSCKSEYEMYSHEKSSLFTVTNLGEATSTELDKRVTDACSKIPRPSVGINLFGSPVKKWTFAVLFLACGFFGGAYVALNMDVFSSGSFRVAARNEQTKIVNNGQNSASSSVVSSNEIASRSVSSDSIKNDSVLQKSQYNANRLGNIGQQGVVPVDLQGK